MDDMLGKPLVAIGVRMRNEFTFFDLKNIPKKVDKAAYRVLSKIGAFIWTAARQSIKRPGKKKRGADRISRPGSPPYSHTGLLKKGILFGFDFESQSVVIGPTKLRDSSEVPQLLEFGGEAMREDRRDGKNMVSFMATYRPRPFMGPAYEREIPKLPAMWRDSVKR